MAKNSTRFYRHYKNKPYKLIGTVRHSETLEEMALYESLYDNELGRLWVRPKGMFFEDVEIAGVKKPRFEKIQFDFSVHREISEAMKQEIMNLHEVCFNSKLSTEKLDSVIKMHSKILLTVCREQRRLLGFKLGYGKDGDTFYSWLGGVHPDFRDLGVAAALMTAQHQECKKDGYKKLETKTRGEFLPMLKLNLNHGYKITGTVNDDTGKIKVILEKILE